jgi:aspartyl/asparaginyl beta-hydroxylase (cupin superfamily)
MSATDPVQRSVTAALDLLKRGKPNDAIALLTSAERDHPRALDIKLQKAAALRALGDLPGALAALDAALAIEPLHFVSLLSKGAVLERMGRPRAAATVYGNALKLAPRPEQTPAPLAPPIARARELVRAQASSLADHLKERTSALRAANASEPLARFIETLEVLAGTKRVYNAEPVQVHVSRLPAIPFFDRELFPWLPELEAATEVIRAELTALLDAGMPDFAPYIDYPPGTPVNQWGELNRSRSWSSYWLWRDGKRQDDAIARCPRTADIVSALPLADTPGLAPTVMFSALAARTRIPPHTGSTNARAIVHLPLILPGPAGFRVGNEVRAWRMGEAWVFDDTIEHEAWNEADETRVLLIFDVWNPLLSPAERELLNATLAARDAWFAEESATREPDRTPP